MQEYSAQRDAAALQRLLTIRCRVVRAGESYELDAEMLVPGDVILLESGDHMPADARLLESRDLEVDESLLTGESLAVAKESAACVGVEASLADRRNMVYAGSLVIHGRVRALVVATGAAAKPPLLLRMERFSRGVAVAVAVDALLLAGVALMHGMSWEEIFFLAVALAVSAIP